MWENIKDIVRYRLKILEFRYRTWKNAREISKAYGLEIQPLQQFKIAPKKITGKNIRKVIRPAALGLGAVAGGALLIYGVYFLIQLQPVQPPKASIGKNHFDQSSKKIPIKPMEANVNKPDTHAEILVSKDTANMGGQKAANKDSVQINQPSPATVGGDYHVILANKATKQFYLLAYQGGHWSVVHQYRIATGGQDGRKQNAGDKRTPEGTYYIIGRKERSELSSIYGSLAYVLNYPNEEDRKAGRTGQGIWIHGTDKDSTPDKTKGCLALSNSDLTDISKYLGGGIGTPVVIISDPGLKAPASAPSYDILDKGRLAILESQRNTQEYFKNYLKDWITAWESKDIERYKNFYAVDVFSGQGLDWKAWREKKIRTFQAYKTINVAVNKLLITDISDSTAVVKFVQVYKSDQNRIENGKKLVYIKENGQWKISREETFPKEELL